MNCASRTGFYAPHTLANFQSLPKFYPSVRAPRWRELVARAYHNSLYNQCPRWRELVARAYHNSFSGYDKSFILRLSFAYPSSHTRLCQLADFPSLILRLSFPRWRELVARAYHNSLYNQCASHFGKL